MRTSSSHEEGAQRDWAVATQSFAGEDGHVTHLNVVRVDWLKDESGQWKMTDLPGSAFQLKADLVLLAGDPLNNVSDTLNIVAVVRNGRFYSLINLLERAAPPRRRNTIWSNCVSPALSTRE